MFARDLRRLNDVLAGTPLAGRYAVCGGLLLGWARDRRILLDDLHDADFTYSIDDAAAFAAAARALAEAGFAPEARFVNNEGMAVEYRFRYHRARFEFFAVITSEGRACYFMFDEADELLCERPAQALESFRFLRRSWLKPEDHEGVLTATYGDWRSPNPDWHFANARTVVERRPARFGMQRWDDAGRRTTP